MAYHELTKETGGSADNRRAEADRIVKILTEGDVSEFSQKEIDFIHQMEDGGPVSAKQLFWLRDIKDKY